MNSRLACFSFYRAYNQRRGNMTGESIEELQAELSKLRQENNDLKRIFRDIPDTYYCTDLDGRIVMVSPSAKTLIGCPTKDLIGQQITDYYIHPEDRVVFLEKLAASGGVIRDHEHQIRRANGEIIWLSTNSQYVYDDEKNIIGVEGIIRNITACKEMEEKVIDAEKFQVLCGLIGGIAHHFNNDLAAMTGSLYLFKHKVDKTHEAYNNIGMLENKIFHIADMIKNLLTFSEYSFMPASMKLCHAGQLLQQVVEKFEASCDESLHVQLNISDYEANISCDMDKISLALEHLLDNAKHAVKGLPKALIVIQLRVIPMPEDEQVVEIKIVDCGCGMTSEDLAHVKEPFFTTRDVGEGQGLGLSVATGIIHQHQGNLHLKSSLGEGTTVFVHLPVCADIGKENIASNAEA